PLDVELFQQRIEILLAPLAIRLDDFEHRADVLLDRQAAKDRSLLGQIADAETGALVHRQRCDVVALELDIALVGVDEAGDHIEHGGLAGDEAFLDALDDQHAFAIGAYGAIAVGAAARRGLLRRPALLPIGLRRRCLGTRLDRRRQARNVHVAAVDHPAHGGQIDGLVIGERRLPLVGRATAQMRKNAQAPRSPALRPRIMFVRRDATDSTLNESLSPAAPKRSIFTALVLDRWS